jgi:hypothetical protein
VRANWRFADEVVDGLSFQGAAEKSECPYRRRCAGSAATQRMRPCAAASFCQDSGVFGVGHEWSPTCFAVRNLAKLRGRPDYAMGDATEQVEGCNDASCFFNSRSRKGPTMGRLLRASRHSSAWGEERKKGDMPRCPTNGLSPTTVETSRGVGYRITPLVAGSLLQKPPAALPSIVKAWRVFPSSYVDRPCLRDVASRLHPR